LNKKVGEKFMDDLIIKNGTVFDPINNIDGEKMDIAIKNGKIVEKADSNAKVIDASQMIVMPGGVDLHAHIAGSKVNSGRLFRPEDHRNEVYSRTTTTRAGVGHSVPSTWTTGYRYVNMGYTFAAEPAVPPLKARHTHEELRDTPIIDKMCFPLFGNNWFVMECIANDDLDMLSAYIAWMLKATKGYAIKIVCPGGSEAFSWGKTVNSLDDLVPSFEVTPRQIIRYLAQANEKLGLPHSIHLHTVCLGQPGNVEVTLESLKAVEDIKVNGNGNNARNEVVHLTHIQFHSYGGTGWRDFSSGAAEIADYLNKHPHVSFDLGQIMFGDTTTMTGDSAMEYSLYKLTHNKWLNGDVEFECGSGVVPFNYSRKSPINAVQWTIGMEYALLVENPWRMVLTTDHPNGGPFTTYPGLISWLMSKKARDGILKSAHKNATSASTLSDIDRELSFYEIAIMTRAAAARLLALKNKGHLGIGADADVAVYKFDPALNPSDNHVAIQKAFSNTAYTIKDGEVVAKDGKILASPEGRTFWLDIKIPAELENALLPVLEQKFRSYYTIQLSNYPVVLDYLPRSTPIQMDVTQNFSST
jgi:formylmethanofuran dehydrogenase subunit A